MTLATVDQLVGQFRGAISQVVIDVAATPEDVYLALKRLTREFTMPEKTHATAEIPLPGGGEGGEGGNGGTPEPEVATITSIDPPSGVVGQAIDITVRGTGFTASSVVSLNGNPLQTTPVDATTVETFIPGPLPGQAGITEITVDGSSPYPFEIIEAVSRRSR